MKIACVYDAVFPWETGGVQKRVWEISRRLAERHDIHWYGLKYWSGQPVINQEGVTLHGVMTPTDLYTNGRRSIAEAISFGARLLRPLLNETFDVIDCQAFPYFSVFSSKFQSLVRHSTLLMTWHEIWDNYWYEYLGWRGVLGKAIERLTASLPNEHVAVSERTRRDLQQLGVPDAKLVPNGIEMAEIEPVPADDRTIDLLYVGRLIPEKNVELLVRAVANLQVEEREIRCFIVGDGPDRARIESLVAELGLDQNVRLEGTIDNYENVLSLMKAADVFVLPSRREGFGISALEALACGTPVVTIDHPQNAVQELVESGTTGAICEPSVDAIANGIRRTRSTASPVACTASARQYEWNRIAEITERIYTNVAR